MRTVMLLVISLLLLPIISFRLLPTVEVRAQAPFYQGKTITLVVGSGAGTAYDIYGRLLATHIGKHIPGNPSVIVQNMPAAGGLVAANFVYGVSKPDGLTLASINPAHYFNQLQGNKEVKFDWAKFIWIASPDKSEHMLYMRSDTPYKSMQDIRKATERNEVVCRSFTTAAYFGREPYHSWRKKNFVRVLMQTGHKRDPLLPETPTLNELMDEFKTSDMARRVSTVMLGSGELGRPIVAHPATPADRAKVLREAFMKAMADPALREEAKLKNLEITPVNGEELAKIAKEVIDQPPEVVERIKKILAQ